MTTRKLIEYYTYCLAAAIAAGQYFGPIAAIAAFAGTAILQTHQQQTQRRP